MFGIRLKKFAKWCGLVAGLFLTCLPIYYSHKRDLADSFFLEFLWSDVYEGGDFWGWQFTKSPAFFPDVVGYGVIFPFFDYAADRYFTLAILQIFLLIGSCLGVLRLLSEVSWHRIGPLVTLEFAVISYLSYSSDIWLFVHSTNNHIGTYILSACSLILLVRHLSNPSSIKLLLLFISMVFGIVNGKLYLATFIAPAIAGGIAFFFLARKHSNAPLLKRLMSLALIIIFAMLGSFLVTPTLFPFSILDDPEGFSQKRLDHALKTLEAATREGLKWNLARYFLLLLVLFGMVRLVADLWKSRLVSPNNIGFIRIFILLSLITAFLASIGTGVFKDVGGYRYLFFSFELFILYGFYALSLRRHLLKRLSKLAFLLTLVGGILSVVFFNQLKPRKLSVDEVRVLKGVKEVSLAQCVKEVRDSHALSFGLADFWVTTPVNYLVGENILLNFNNRHDLETYLHMGPVDTYQKCLGTSCKVDFVVIDAITRYYHLTSEHIPSVFGVPDKIVTCQDDVAKIAIYSSEKLSSIAHLEIRQLFERLDMK